MKIVTVPALGVSAVAVLMARTCVRVAPGPAIRWASAAPRAGVASRAAIDAFSCAVPTVGRLCGATCLEQSLALTFVLTAFRVPARLVIGVDRSADVLTAHAWVESGGRAVLGGAEASKYASLPAAVR